MPRPLLPLPLLLLACLGTSPRPEEPPAGPEVWVRGDAPPGGDGTRERPLRQLQEALARVPSSGSVLRVRLAPGRYAGQAVLPPGTRLLAAGAGVVLGGDLQAPAGAHLEGLAVEGGTWGLQGGGALELVDVVLRGQREGGLRVTAGRLHARGLRLEAAAAGATVGLAVGGAGQAEVEGLQLRGPFGRGLEVTGTARLQVDALEASGPATVLHQRGGQVRLRRSALGGGQGAGLYVVGGRLTLEEVIVLGHEYGLHAGRDSTLEVRGFASVGAQRAGMGVVASRARLEDVLVLRAGTFGGLQFVNSRVDLRRFGIQDARGYGLSAVQGRLEASEGRIVRTRDDGSGGSDSGDALQLREGEALVQGVQVREAAGLGFLAAQGVKARVEDLGLERCASGGVLVDTRAQLQLRGLRVRSGAPPALGVMGRGQASAEVVDAEEGPEALWADCATGAQLRLGYGTPPGLTGPCVRR